MIRSMLIYYLCFTMFLFKINILLVFLTCSRLAELKILAVNTDL